MSERSRTRLTTGPNPGRIINDAVRVPIQGRMMWKGVVADTWGASHVVRERDGFTFRRRLWRQFGVPKEIANQQARGPVAPGTDHQAVPVTAKPRDKPRRHQAEDRPPSQDWWIGPAGWD